MKLEGIPKFLHPRMRLFMSIDLVGSTALKQSGSFPIQAPNDGDRMTDAGSRWFVEITKFYTEFQAKFARHWQHYCSAVASEPMQPTGETPQLWKSNGDELIYVMEITTAKECAATVICWLRSGKEYRRQLRDKGSSLDVKMAAWVAGFPVVNSEVIFQPPSDIQTVESEDEIPELVHYDLLDRWHSGDEGRRGLSIDYIGPSIDTGFRVASKATPRKFTLSLETAFILSLPQMQRDMNDIVFRYDGRETLKGVLGGKPYPIFWIDTQMDDELTRLEDSLEGRSEKGLPKDHVKEFCEEFFARHKSNMIRPFILTDFEPLLVMPPDNYEAHVRHLADEWRAARESDAIAMKALGEAEPPDGESAPPVQDELLLDQLIVSLPLTEPPPAT
ncbi:hypothetical protein [Azospirillum thermophilum]|uniref:Uncharacterized protein n=1 Tax=Azospirillum thermophilum TaxID=2202148 RepID=A0A2S2CVE6_9PROT|nr:hypothetical protein [Azospirillum thermophilum]AWK88494.1 hypothetical protein DEW08_20755 [Azospirillum thermophilum]